MAGKDSTTEQAEKYEWLGDLLDRAFWPLDGFLKLLEDNEDDGNLSAALGGLVGGVKKNVAMIEDVVAKSLGGHIKVETTDAIRTFGLFDRVDFGKAYIDPPKEPQAAPGGGAA